MEVGCFKFGLIAILLIYRLDSGHAGITDDQCTHTVQSNEKKLEINPSIENCSSYTWFIRPGNESSRILGLQSPDLNLQLSRNDAALSVSDENGPFLSELTSELTQPGLFWCVTHVTSGVINVTVTSQKTLDFSVTYNVTDYSWFEIITAENGYIDGNGCWLQNWHRTLEIKSVTFTFEVLNLCPAHSYLVSVGPGRDPMRANGSAFVVTDQSENIGIYVQTANTSFVHYQTGQGCVSLSDDQLQCTEWCPGNPVQIAFRIRFQTTDPFIPMTPPPTTVIPYPYSEQRLLIGLYPLTENLRHDKDNAIRIFNITRDYLWPKITNKFGKNAEFDNSSYFGCDETYAPPTFCLDFSFYLPDTNEYVNRSDLLDMVRQNRIITHDTDKIKIVLFGVTDNLNEFLTFIFFAVFVAVIVGLIGMVVVNARRQAATPLSGDDGQKKKKKKGSFKVAPKPLYDPWFGVSVDKGASERAENIYTNRQESFGGYNNQAFVPDNQEQQEQPDTATAADGNVSFRDTFTFSTGNRSFSLAGKGRVNLPNNTTQNNPLITGDDDSMDEDEDHLYDVVASASMTSASSPRDVKRLNFVIPEASTSSNASSSHRGSDSSKSEPSVGSVIDQSSGSGSGSFTVHSDSRQEEEEAQVLLEDSSNHPDHHQLSFDEELAQAVTVRSQGSSPGEERKDTSPSRVTFMDEVATGTAVMY